ncbi:MAG TPA: protein kinase [Polyangiaceae bacterium]|nr:protein kinase [Polyangiaceae bacterium]
MTGAAEPILEGIVAGRYRVIKLLGRGGMGAVYLAEKLALRKQVALKVLLAEHASEPSIMARFEREAISAASIKHPNVVEVFDFGRLADGACYLEMEFLEGNDLREEIARHGVLEPSRAVQIALVICRALAAAHANGIVHRDLKPENVFIQRAVDGEEIVKVVDFGIAQLKSGHGLAEGASERRLTRTGSVFGTPEYMSPEQASGKHVDLRADVYALGIILYKMLTGSVPFTGDTLWSVLGKQVEAPVPQLRSFYPELTISPELEALVLRALEKQPEARFPSMLEFAQALSATPEARARVSHISVRPSTSDAGDSAGVVQLESAAPPLTAARTEAAVSSAKNSRALLFGTAALVALAVVLALFARYEQRTGPSTAAASPSPRPSIAPGAAERRAVDMPSEADSASSTPPLCESTKDGIRVVSPCRP